MHVYKILVHIVSTQNLSIYVDPPFICLTCLKCVSQLFTFINDQSVKVQHSVQLTFSILHLLLCCTISIFLIFVTLIYRISKMTPSNYHGIRYQMPFLNIWRDPSKQVTRTSHHWLHALPYSHNSTPSS